MLVEAQWIVGRHGGAPQVADSVCDLLPPSRRIRGALL